MNAAANILTIDGAQGEGGGQVLRSSLAMSLITRRPVRIVNIRAGRPKPGLMRQHLTSVKAAAEIGRARVTGAEIGAREVVFHPGEVAAGEYHFAVGTAGSVMLVLQTVLPALLVADGPSRLTLEGGTHNMAAPPFDFIERVFLPVLAGMGARVTATLVRPGFYPAGGGRCTVEIEPAQTLRPVELMARGEVVRRRAVAMICNLPRHVAERELNVVHHKLGWDEDCCEVAMVSGHGPGNVVMLEIESQHARELCVAFGSPNLPAEAVASQAVDDAKQYLAHDAPVGVHLADQLIIPMVMAGGGAFATLPLSRHAQTNIEVVRRFVDVPIEVDTSKHRSCVVRFGE
jgi:RNA 3'-terminal phosphate cyclase (ATP)